MKRALDLIIAGLALVVLSPVMIAIAAVVFLLCGSPVIYRGRRVGHNGRPFYILKFRTMVRDADKAGPVAVPSDDFRVTRTGRFLRRTKLDELPQLFNVIRGEMSLVGPRPDTEEYVARLSPGERIILHQRPGITDWASLWNFDEGGRLRGNPDPEAEYVRSIWPTKIRLQLHYVKTRSLWTDIRILLYTVRRLFRPSWVPDEVKRFIREEVRAIPNLPDSTQQEAH